MDFALTAKKNYRHHDHNQDDHNVRYRAEVKSLTRTLEQLQKHGATLGVPLPGTSVIVTMVMMPVVIMVMVIMVRMMMVVIMVRMIVVMMIMVRMMMARMIMMVVIYMHLCQAFLVTLCRRKGGS